MKIGKFCWVLLLNCIGLYSYAQQAPANKYGLKKVNDKDSVRVIQNKIDSIQDTETYSIQDVEEPAVEETTEIDSSFSDYYYEVPSDTIRYWHTTEMAAKANQLEGYYNSLLNQKQQPVASSSSISTFFKIVKWAVIVVAIIGLLILLYSILFKSNFNIKKVFQRKEKDTQSTSTDEVDDQDINSNDFNTLLSQAETNQNYALAIRLLFLETLQLLNKRKKIEYQKHKTNVQYAYELNNDIRPQFREIASIYEYFWYGKTALNAETYQMLKQVFTNFKADAKK